MADRSRAVVWTSAAVMLAASLLCVWLAPSPLVVFTAGAGSWMWWRHCRTMP